MSKEKVEIELSANSAKLKSEFDAARARVNRFKKGVASAVKSVGGLAAGVLGLAAGARVIEDLRNKFDRIGKLANRFEMPVEEVQRLAVAADLSGASLEKLASSLVRGNTAAYDAQKGSKQLADAFVDLGINAEEFAAAGETRKVEMLADAYTGAADKATAMAAGTKILGRGFSELVPLLNEGSAGIRAMTEGIQTLDASEIQAIEKFNDDLTVLKANVQAGIAKQFAGEMKNLAPTIIAVGQSLANATQFIVRHHRAIGLLIGAVVAYKAAKFGVAMAKDLVTILRTGTALLATKAATEAETKAVVKNTAAHAANAMARKASDAAAMRSAGTKGGAMMGNHMGKSAAGKFPLAFLAKFTPHAIAAAVGFGIGKLAGDHMAGKMQESFEGAFKKANAPADGLLSKMQQMVTTATTVEQTAAARAKMTAEIARLERENLSLGDGMKKSANEHAIATLKIWNRSADTYRVRAQQLEVEKDITGEYELQVANQAFANDLFEKGAAAAKKRKEAMEKAADAIRDSIAELKSGITDTQIDLLPPEKKVEVFTERLRRGLKAAVGEFNFGRAGQGLDVAGPSAESLKGLYALAQKAQAEGNEGLAKSLLEQVAALQKVQAEIRTAKGDVASEAVAAAQKEADLARERADKEKEIADLKRAQAAAKGRLGEELAVLRLEAAGEMKKAEILRTQLRLKREAMEIAEQTGVSEEEALRIARTRENLKQRADGIRAGQESTGGGDEGGRKKIRLFGAEESLKRRLARQSGGIGSRSNMNSMDRRNTDLGQRFVREAEAGRSGPMTAVMQGNDAVPGKLDQLISLEEKMVKIFDNVIKV